MRRSLALLAFALAIFTCDGAYASRGEPEATVVLVRPEPGPRRGALAVPATTVYGASGIALVASAGYLLARIRSSGARSRRTER
ncbi:MAG: hypothetical protein H5U40_16745 [Polyangiaceae bacterium]|nr:hypothetical protein [Polyangiaceae bacterium]